MTRNQIDWQNMLISKKRQGEDARHNLATEIELNRSNVAKEYLTRRDIQTKINSLDEAIRHNKVAEWIDNFRQTETQRHNQVDEARNALNVQLQHMDRAEGNRITESFNKLNTAIRELERIDKNENMDQTAATARMKVLNDYAIAMKQWKNDVTRVENDTQRTKNESSLVPYQQKDYSARTFQNITKGAGNLVTTVGDLFDIVKNASK